MGSEASIAVADGSKAATRRPRFSSPQPFRAALLERVDTHFAEAGIPRTGGARMIVKTAVMLGWLLASYLGLVFVATAWWHAALLATSLALAIAGVAMAIHHDANHGAYSSRPWVNNLCKRTLDALGVSSYIWGWTHNVFHHTYTNLEGVDQDVDLGPLARLAPDQRRRWYHRAQHWYMWPLYGFTIVYFVFAEDFIQLHRARYGPHKFPAPRGLELVGVFASKLFVFAWALVVPLMFHPVWLVVGVLAAVWFVAGLILGVTFQVAHLVPESSFPRAADIEPRLDREWAVHQVENTANFAPGNRLVTWYVGGLNHQIEHHLFPRVCHVHYPRLAPLVRETCEAFGVPYRVYGSVFEAVRAHGRWLAEMGTAEENPDRANFSCAAGTPAADLSNRS